MKKAAMAACLFPALFFGSLATAQADTYYTFGFSIGAGPATPVAPVYYPSCPPCSCADCCAQPHYATHTYRTYAVPRRYASDRYRSHERNRCFRDRDRRNQDRWIRHDNGSRSRSRSGRWR